MPFPIQLATIPDVLAGRDVLGKARTGSGKTLAFGLPILARVADLPKPERHQVHALVLVPTRELAMQVGDALEPYAHATQLTYRLVAGGLSMSKQIMAVERGVHLVVATPGRLADLVRRGHIDLSHTSITVLDEADHMAEMGFGEEIAEILDKTPADAQRLLFSATLDGVVDDLVRRYMHNPVMHDVTDGSAMPTQRHVMISLPPHEKYKMATRMAAREGRTMCFVRTKLAADRIAADMRANGVLAVALHGDRSQAERNFVMVEFRSGRLPVLVATDVAARGIHVDAVDLVIQIDPPADHRDYTHRSGRTGRAGADGLAVMLVLPHQRNAALRVLDEANIRAEDAAFRVIDAAALAEIDALTGAQQPSGIPVIEPMPVMHADRRGGRDRGGNDPRGGRDRPGRERPSRARPVTSSRDDAAFAAKRDHLTAKERELADRERALALREQQLSHQASTPAAAPSHTERPDRPERRDYTERPDRTERPQRGAGYQGNRDDSRGERPARTSGYQGTTGYQGNRDDSRGERPARTSGYQGTTGYQGNRDDSRGERPARTSGYRGTTGYQGNRDDSRGERPATQSRTGWAPRKDDSRGERPATQSRTGWAPRKDDSRGGYRATTDRGAYAGNREAPRGARPAWGNRDDRSPRREDSPTEGRTSAPRRDFAPPASEPGHGAAHKSKGKDKTTGRQPPGSRRGKARPKKKD